MPQLTTGKGKEAMEPPFITSKRTLEALSASLPLQPDHDDVVATTTCHFCRRADLWLYFTCAVCQLTTHDKCYYRLGSDEATYYETNISDWKCQDCGGPQRHADYAISDDGQEIKRQAGPRPSNSGYAALGMPSEDYTMGSDNHDGCIVQQHSKKPRRQQAKKYKHPQGIRPPRPKETKRN